MWKIPQDSLYIYKDNICPICQKKNVDYIIRDVVIKYIPAFSTKILQGRVSINCHEENCLDEMLTLFSESYVKNEYIQFFPDGSFLVFPQNENSVWERIYKITQA